MTNERWFRVALTADFFDEMNQLKYVDIGLDILQREKKIGIDRFSEHFAEVDPEQLVGVNGAIILTPRVTAHSLMRSDDLLVLARFGVGYDSVDVAACTDADVLLTITSGAVDHSVAEATVGWLLALTHHLRVKDRLVRDGGWEKRSHFMGSELRDRTVGIIGFGGIGRALVRMLAGFSMATPLVFDPFISDTDAAKAGVRKVALEDLLRESDFVSLHCPLNEKTRNLLGAREMALMKPTAYLLNTARGGIVDEESLLAALKEGRIAGAALDCFTEEPVRGASPFANFDNVLLAPHSIAWTHELFREIGRAACSGIVDLSDGKRPRGVVNPEVFEREGFQRKWERLCGPFQ